MLFHQNAYFTSVLTKKLHLLGYFVSQTPYYQGSNLCLDPGGGLPSSRPLLRLPNHGDWHIDAYNRISIACVICLGYMTVYILWQELAYCYNGECRSHDSQCLLLWGDNTMQCGLSGCAALNTGGLRSRNCGYDVTSNTFLPCDFRYV